MIDAEVVAALGEEIRILRQVLDEIREELSWANNNAEDLPNFTGATSAYRRITSMSADPTARDFQVNTADAATLCKLREEAAQEASPRTSTQASLF